MSFSRLLNLNVFEIVINATQFSFFGELSRLSSSRIVIEVIPLSRSGDYIVFSYSPNKNVQKYIDVIRKSRDLTSHMHKFYYWIDDGVTYIMALKRACRFFKMAEDSNVIIRSPYEFNKGVRRYFAVGEAKDIEEYIERLLRVYGYNNVAYRRIEFKDHLGEAPFRTAAVSLMLERFTQSELTVLKKAYDMGYFELPKNVTLDDVAKTLKLSKVTTNIHLRKILKKIMDEIVKYYKE